MNMQKVIDVARKYVNLYEIKPNAQWTSKSNPSEAAKLSNHLVDLMESGGWEKGWPYCMAFVEAVYREALQDDPKALALVAKLLTPSAMMTYKNCKPYLTKTPTPGGIFIMQKAQGGTGHAGIVVSSDGSKFSTIEGNTSPAATTAEQDRNGDGIYAKSRALNFTVTDGLHLIGFVDLSKIV